MTAIKENLAVPTAEYYNRAEELIEVKGRELEENERMLLEAIISSHLFRKPMPVDEILKAESLIESNEKVV